MRFRYPTVIRCAGIRCRIGSVVNNPAKWPDSTVLITNCTPSHRFITTATIESKDSPVNGTSASVGPAMSDRLGESEAFLGFSSPDQRSINCFKPLLCEPFFTVGAGLPRVRLAGGWLCRSSKRVDIDRGQFVGPRSGRSLRRHAPRRTRPTRPAKPQATRWCASNTTLMACRL